MVLDPFPSLGWIKGDFGCVHAWRPFITTGKGGFFGVSNVTYGINIAALFLVVKRKAAFRFAESGIFLCGAFMYLFLKGFVDKRNFAFDAAGVSFSTWGKAK